jgi:ABC-type glycerol-3-phosphate transport system substrate-binding protein
VKTLKRTTAGVVAIAATSLVLAACSGSGAGTSSDDGRVSISVSGLPDRSKAEERTAFEERLEQFRADNPDIDIEANETLYDQQTFAAQLAGGTLPTVIAVPPGELRGLIEREQVRDVTEWVEGNDTLANIPEALMANAQDAAGRYYGVPEYAYSIGIMINRSLFEAAGLDPDDPFETWDDLRAAAKAITDATGEIGFALPTTEEYGGWLVSSMIPGMGDPVMVERGDEHVLDLLSDSVQQMFQLLHGMRWEDGSMGTNSLLSSGELGNLFAGGKIGIAPQGGDAFQHMTLVNGLPVEDYGMFPMPQDADGQGTSGGGRVSIIRPDATDEQVEAVVKWLEYLTFEPYTSEEAAVAWAEAREAEGLPVPEVGLPRVSGETYAQFMEWIEPYINVPLDQIQSYLDSADTLPIVADPPFAAGEIFAALDPAIQAVLGRADADIPALLQVAQDAAQPAVEAAQRG